MEGSGGGNERLSATDETGVCFGCGLPPLECVCEEDDEGAMDEIRGAVARGWCSPENSHKEMDAVLAEAIAQEIKKLAHSWADR